VLIALKQGDGADDPGSIALDEHPLLVYPADQSFRLQRRLPQVNATDRQP